MDIVPWGRDRNHDRDELRHSPRSTKRARFEGSTPFEFKGWGLKASGLEARVKG